MLSLFNPLLKFMPNPPFNPDSAKARSLLPTRYTPTVSAASSFTAISLPRIGRSRKSLTAPYIPSPSAPGNGLLTLHGVHNQSLCLARLSPFLIVSRSSRTFVSTSMLWCPMACCLAVVACFSGLQYSSWLRATSVSSASS